MNYIKFFLALTLALFLTVIPAAPAMAAATLFMQPSSGKIAVNIEAYGSGFEASTQYELFFSDEVASVGGDIDTHVRNYEFLGRPSTNSAGAFEGFIFPVPDRLTHGSVLQTVRSGSYYLYAAARFSKEIVARASFTVIGVPAIVIDPATGTTGSEVRVTATDFAASRSVVITYDGTQVTTTTTNSAGGFSNVAFTVPASSRGNHTVKVEDTSNNSATATFSIQQSITVTPTSGAGGDAVTVSGTGFAATRSISITFDGIEVATATTSSVGSFSAVTFTVPARGAGSYDIQVNDAGNNSASVEFALAASSFSISPTSGFAGTQVTVNGSGFQASSPVTITFNNTTVAPINSDASGSFNTSFDVPSPLAGGSYKVKASDGINSTEADFSIKTNASISSETGHVGTELTISGIGFTAGGVATVTYDGAQVATAPVAADGTFQASFKVPAGSAGTYSIVATDGVNTEPFTFTMESTPPSPPVPLKPEMGIKAEKETFFDWEDVEDPSGVTYTLQIATDDDFRAGSIVLEETGLTESEYTITEENRLESVSEDEPYYWHVRAVDGAGNESEWSGAGSFYVGFTFGLGQGVKIALFVIGGLFLVVIGFWLGRKTAYF